jgi:hypothetical protein
MALTVNPSVVTTAGKLIQDVAAKILVHTTIGQENIIPIQMIG